MCRLFNFLLTYNSVFLLLLKKETVFYVFTFVLFLFIDEINTFLIILYYQPGLVGLVKVSQAGRVYQREDGRT